jgi:hypothetical protein
MTLAEIKELAKAQCPPMMVPMFDAAFDQLIATHGEEAIMNLAKAVAVRLENGESLTSIFSDIQTLL